MLITSETLKFYKDAMDFANAAYLLDRKDLQNFAQAKGASFVNQFNNTEAQAAIFQYKGYYWVANSGTHFFDHTIVRQIYDNLEDGRRFIEGYGNVVKGAWDPFADLAPMIAAECNGPIISTGHSLGAARCPYLKYYIDERPIFSVGFAGWRSADNAFWRKLYPVAGDKPEQIINADDPAPNWPFVEADDLDLPNLNFYWMKDDTTGYLTTHRPGWNYIDWSAHMPEHYLNRISLLAAKA